MHIEIAEQAPGPTSDRKEAIENSAAEVGFTEEREQELNVNHQDIDAQKSKLDEVTTSSLPENLNLDQRCTTHPLHSDLEALTFGKEAEMLSSAPCPLQLDSKVLSPANEKGNVSEDIADGEKDEESDWPTPSAGMAHGKICPVCFGVVERPKEDNKVENGEGKGNERDGERTDLKPYANTKSVRDVGVGVCNRGCKSSVEKESKSAEDGEEGK
jgi:hypothetical protein